MLFKSKYLAAALLASLFLFTGATAWEVMLEGKAANLRPTSSNFREIYGNGGIYGGEVTVPVWRNFALFGSASYYSKDGHSTAEHHKTKLELIPIGIGVKYFIPFDCYDFYLGAGIDILLLKTHDKAEHVRKHISKSGVGGLFKGGVVYDISENVFFDLFAEYSLKEFSGEGNHDERVYSIKADISNWRLGIGIGYRFGCF